MDTSNLATWVYDNIVHSDKNKVISLIDISTSDDIFLKLAIYYGKDVKTNQSDIVRMCKELETIIPNHKADIRIEFSKIPKCIELSCLFQRVSVKSLKDKEKTISHLEKMYNIFGINIDERSPELIFELAAEYQSRYAKLQVDFASLSKAYNKLFDKGNITTLKKNLIYLEDELKSIKARNYDLNSYNCKLKGKITVLTKKIKKKDNSMHNGHNDWRIIYLEKNVSNLLAHIDYLDVLYSQYSKMGDEE